MAVDASIVGALGRLSQQASAASSPTGARARVALNATLAACEDVGPSIRRFWIRPDDGVQPFKPGQYMSIGLAVEEGLLQRPYSTASPPGTAPEIEFLIRRVPNGSLTSLLWAHPVGARLHLGRPKGLFGLLPDDPRTHLFVATGTGLAPFVSMLTELRKVPRPPSVVIVHGVSRVAELAYRGRLEALAETHPEAVRYRPVISRPQARGNEGWTGLRGRIDAVLETICDRERIEPDATVAYLCGNPQMIEGARTILTARGLPAAAIRSEEYWPAAQARGG